MEKTYREWFDHFPEELKRKAIHNALNEGVDLNTTQSSLHSAIISGFTWEKSNEGHNYWSKIADDASNGLYDEPVQTENYSIY